MSVAESSSGFNLLGQGWILGHNPIWSHLLPAPSNPLKKKPIKISFSFDESETE